MTQTKTDSQIWCILLIACSRTPTESKEAVVVGAHCCLLEHKCDEIFPPPSFLPLGVGTFEHGHVSLEATDPVQERIVLGEGPDEVALTGQVSDGERILRVDAGNHHCGVAPLPVEFPGSDCRVHSTATVVAVENHPFAMVEADGVALMNIPVAEACTGSNV